MHVLRGSTGIEVRSCIEPGIPFFSSPPYWISPRSSHLKSPSSWTFAQKARISFGVLARLSVVHFCYIQLPLGQIGKKIENKRINGDHPSYSLTTFLGSSGQKGSFSLGVLGVISLQLYLCSWDYSWGRAKRGKRRKRKTPRRFPPRSLDNRNAFSQSSDWKDRVSLYFVAHTHFKFHTRATLRSTTGDKRGKNTDFSYQSLY